MLALGGENNNTLDGKTQFPTVKDPGTGEINRFHASYELPLDSVVTVGRQRHPLDDRRWVGNAGFRQNETTFDSIRLDNTAIEDLTATYINVFSSHRALGDDVPQGDLNMSTNLANVAYEGFAVGRVAVHGYLVDLDEIPSQSSMTFGARLTGSQDVGSDLAFVYAAEYAHQSDYGNSPTGFGLNYVLLEPGLRYRTVVVKIGYALLGGNGNRGVQTPLASRHGKQGWADQFTNTPGGGIRDLYGNITYTVDGFGIVDDTELTAAYTTSMPTIPARTMAKSSI